MDKLMKARLAFIDDICEVCRRHNAGIGTDEPGLDMDEYECLYFFSKDCDDSGVGWVADLESIERRLGEHTMLTTMADMLNFLFRRDSTRACFLIIDLAGRLNERDLWDMKHYFEGLYKLKRGERDD